MKMIIGPLREWIKPDVSDPAVWCHLVYAIFSHLFTQNVRLRIIVRPIREWIRPDVSDSAAMGYPICAAFLHLFTVNLGVKIMLAL